VQIAPHGIAKETNDQLIMLQPKASAERFPSVVRGVLSEYQLVIRVTTTFSSAAIPNAKPRQPCYHLNALVNAT